jgi:PDZ domain
MLDPLTLIAFIVVVILAALIVVLKYTGGLSKAQEFLLGGVPLQKGEFVKIVNAVLGTLLAIAGMLFALLAYQLYLNPQKKSECQIFGKTGNIEIKGTVDDSTILNTGCLTVQEGDSSEVIRKKVEQAKQIISNEVLHNISQMDARLGFVEVALADDSFGEELEDVRQQVAPAFQESFGASYRQLIDQQKIASLREALNSRPLRLDYGEPLIRMLQDGQVDSREVMAFYSHLTEVQDASDSLLDALSGAASESSENQQIVAYRQRSVALAIEKLKNRSEIAHLYGLIVLNSLEISLSSANDKLAELEYLEPRRVIGTTETQKLLAERATEAERLLMARISLLARGEALRDQKLEAYKNLNEELKIQPTDSWNIVVAKAISLRQFGRTAEAVEAFASYGEMFSSSEPTAERYARTAQQFTEQLSALGVEGGIYLYELIAGGTASQAGLEVGDIVISYNGQTISNMEDFVSVNNNAPEGVPLEITYLQMEENGRFSRQTTTITKPMGAGFMPI